MKFFAVLSVLLIVVGCSTTSTDPSLIRSQIPTVDPKNIEMTLAQTNYNTYCAHCHGYDGSGQGVESEERTVALGYKPVPRHDSDGHTWQHPDQILFETIKYGVDSPLDLYIMAEYSSRLSDDEIFGNIEYMKGFWSWDQLNHQAQLTSQFAENNPDWEQARLDIYADETKSE